MAGPGRSAEFVAGAEGVVGGRDEEGAAGPIALCGSQFHGFLTFGSVTRVRSRQAEQQAVADLAGGAGDGDLEGSCAHVRLLLVGGLGPGRN